MNSNTINRINTHHAYSQLENQNVHDNAHARVMIVEDEITAAIDLACHLEEEGYEIIGLVKNSHDAIPMALSTKPDLIIMDIDLPESMDGITAAEKIEKQIFTKIVFTCGHGQQDPRIQRILKDRTHLLIGKPYNFERLKELIRN